MSKSPYLLKMTEIDNKGFMAMNVTVVHVEDNMAHATLIKRQILQQFPQSTVLHLKDGDEAQRYLMDRSVDDQPPQLFLLDLRLPKVNGLDLLRRVREMRELDNLPVIILTTSSARSDVLEAYRCGANGYLVKPLESEQLRDMVKSLCEFWLNWNVSDV